MITSVEHYEFELISKENVGLAWLFSVNPSSCENPGFYADYLKYIAIADKNMGHAVTHLLIDKDHNRIMGYVSLRASSIIFKDENNNLAGKPAIEVYTLAVDQEYERRGVGKALIDYAIAEAYILHNEYVGVRYLVLAADPKAEDFYIRKMEFSPMNDIWEMPKESWSAHCKPLVLEFNFEAEQLELFIDDDDEEDD